MCILQGMCQHMEKKGYIRGTGKCYGLNISFQNQVERNCQCYEIGTLDL